MPSPSGPAPRTSGVGRELTKLRTLTKGGAAFEEVRNRILDGSLLPGSAINQAALADRLGVSITPLREALRRLEGERLVEVRGDQTARVAPLSLRELNELRDVRLRLDPFAASLAATAGREDQLEALLAAADFDLSEDMLAWNRSHAAFHRQIHEMAGNAVLSSLLIQLWERLGRYLPMELTAGDHQRSASGVTHQELAAVIVAADSGGAEQLMREHLQIVIGDVSASLSLPLHANDHGNPSA